MSVFPHLLPRHHFVQCVRLLTCGLWDIRLRPEQSSINSSGNTTGSFEAFLRILKNLKANKKSISWLWRAVLEVPLFSPGGMDVLAEVLNNSSEGKGEIRSHEGTFQRLNMSPLWPLFLLLHRYPRGSLRGGDSRSILSPRFS